MRAWVVEQPRPARDGPLRLVELPDPEPGPGEILVRVRACGVCRTDLHVAEGDLPPHREAVVPGHEVVGTVEACGPAASRFAVGERVGIAWLRHTCGVCRFCRRGAENLCVAPEFTGWDADGGYAELAVVDEAYAYAVPDAFPDLTAAPLLCAGIIGYRALRRAELPEGGRLGIWGFGGSAHLTAQVALAKEPRCTSAPAAGRDRSSRPNSARPRWAGAPIPCRSRWTPPFCSRPSATSCPSRWGRSIAAGPWRSPGSTSATSRASTTSGTCSRSARCAASPPTPARTARRSSRQAAEVPVSVSAVPYPFEEAPRALLDLAEDRVRGAAVLTF